MIVIREGEWSDVALPEGDAVYLRRALGGQARVARSQLRIDRLAGLWALPSGQTLAVQPRKGEGSDVFAWMCAVDPRLLDVSAAATPAGASPGTVVEVAARAFCSILETTLRRCGPRRQYAEQRSLCNALRGRIDWSSYARESLPSRVPCVHWERHLDTPVNRLFSLVLRQLAAEPLLREATAHQLPALLDFFGHVPSTPPPAAMNLQRPLPRLDAPFEPARRLAVVLLECLGLALAGSQPSFTFQVNLARLFERSVEHALLSCSWPHPPRFQLRPFYKGDGAGGAGWSAVDALLQTERGPIVVETKYTSAFSKQHLYQVLAYMKMVDSSIGVLVYPAGAALGTRSFCSETNARWRVLIVELDPLVIAERGRCALNEFGRSLSSSLAQC